MLVQQNHQASVKSWRGRVVAFALTLLGFAASVQGQDAQVTASAEPVVAQTARPAAEAICNDHADDDGDGLTDCGDADCFDNVLCRAGGSEESTERACSDWVDNDGDSMVDCDDNECQEASIQACRGSFRAPAESFSATATEASADDLPELAPGASVEDLIGRGSDANGERNDTTCSDGVDNDGDGRTDCADFGCRFDPQVSICHGMPGVRFSVVAGIGGRIQWNYQNPTGDFGGNYLGNVPDAGFTLLQLRAMGPIPFIPNSFFLVNVRAEESVRLTFVTFQMPLGNHGHYVNVNSGSGTLSAQVIMSEARRTLFSVPSYLVSAFEPGNGASAEVGGPIDDGGKYRFRLFGAAGSGQSTGNVGGRFFRSDERNFSYTLGGQLHWNLVGYYDRFDDFFLTQPAPLTVAVVAGARFDQRASERFIAEHLLLHVRYSHFLLHAEAFHRYVLDYQAQQVAWNATLSVLLVPRYLMAAADIGSFNRLDAYQGGPPTGITPPQEVLQWRVALHYFLFRNVALLGIMYRELRREHDPANLLAADIEREIRLETRFRY